VREEFGILGVPYKIFKNAERGKRTAMKALIPLSLMSFGIFSVLFLRAILRAAMFSSAVSRMASVLTVKRHYKWRQKKKRNLFLPVMGRV
jgi:hypothetical protein